MISALFLLKDVVTPGVQTAFLFSTLILPHTKAKWIISWNTHVAQAHMAEAKGAKQLVICQTSREVNFLSNWDIREVLKILKIKVEEEEVMRKTWVIRQKCPWKIS